MKPLIKIIKMVFSLILCVLFHAFKNIFFFQEGVHGLHQIAKMVCGTELPWKDYLATCIQRLF